MLIQKVLFGSITLVVMSCSSTRSVCRNCGVVLSTFRMYDQKKKEFVIPAYFRDRKMWYKDSCVIAENIIVNIEAERNGAEKWDASVRDYTFIDLRTKMFYVYSSFSDTATLINKYSQPDTGKIVGGWNFFDKKGAFLLSDKQPISDTIMQGIKYGRVIAEGISTSDSISVKSVEIAYLRCDLESFFYIDLPVSIQARCPVVRFDRKVENGFWIKIEVEFLPDKLTKREIKVFNAWEINSKRKLLSGKL